MQKNTKEHSLKTEKNKNFLVLASLLVFTNFVQSWLNITTCCLSFQWFLPFKYKFMLEQELRKYVYYQKWENLLDTSEMATCCFFVQKAFDPLFKASISISNFHIHSHRHILFHEYEATHSIELFILSRKIQINTWWPWT